MGYLEAAVTDGRLVFRPRPDGDLLPFWRLAAERGVEVRRLRRDLPTLEDAVVAVMAGASHGH